MTKKTIAIICVVVLVLSAGLTTWLLLRVPREYRLRLYIWAGVINPAIITEFRDYMRANVHPRFRVDVEFYTSNREMLSIMEQGNNDFDIVMPSDYAVEHMIRHNMIRALDTGRIPANSVFTQNVMDQVIFFESESQPNAQTPQRFSVPIVYGTLGILYDHSINGLYDLLNDYGWQAIWATGTTYNGQHIIADRARVNPIISAAPNNLNPSFKSSGRDAMPIALMAHPTHRAALQAAAAISPQAHQDALREIFVQPTTTMFNQAEHMLNRLHSSTRFEEDEVYIEINTASRSTDLGLEWSISAAYAMAMNTTQSLRYFIPEEGTNIWINTLVVPTTAGGNSQRAYDFINFMSNANRAAANMSVMWGTTAVAEAQTIFYDEITTEDWFTASELSWRQNFLEAMFPTMAHSWLGGARVADRAEVMRYFDQATWNSLTGMMLRVMS